MPRRWRQSSFVPRSVSVPIRRPQSTRIITSAMPFDLKTADNRILQPRGETRQSIRRGSSPSRNSCSDSNSRSAPCWRVTSGLVEKHQFGTAILRQFIGATRIVRAARLIGPESVKRACISINPRRPASRIQIGPNLWWPRREMRCTIDKDCREIAGVCMGRIDKSGRAVVGTMSRSSP